MEFAGNLEDLFAQLSKEPEKQDRTAYWVNDIQAFEWVSGQAPSLSELAEKKLPALPEDGREMPVLTAVTKENIRAFTAWIPPDTGQRIMAALPGEYGIGALMEQEEGYGYLPLGYLQYHVHGTGAAYISIQWLYVSEQWRHRKVASALMAELYRTAEKMGIGSFMVDLPASESMRDMAGFLGEWGFTFSLAVPDTFRAGLAYLKQNKLLAESVSDPQVQCIKELPSSEFRKSFQRILEQIGDQDEQELLATDITWYDSVLSTAYIEDGRAMALLLIHRCPSGKLQVVFLGGQKKVDSKVYMSLLQASVKAACEHCGEAANVELLFRRESGMKLVDRLYPEHAVELVIRAAMSVEP